MSFKVVIADDEPLVLIGLQSLLNWESEGFEIVASVRNGALLEDAIRDYSPDLVITDIKMPVKNGMEVLETVRSEGLLLPVFIFLTSIEEFALIKKAIKLDAVDYIVKLELDKKQLLSALERAGKRINEIKGNAASSAPLASRRLLQDRFFLGKLYALGEGGDVDIDLSYPAFAAACLSIPSLAGAEEGKKAATLFSSTSKLLEETLSRYTPSYVTPLLPGAIAVTFPQTDKQRVSCHSFLLTPLKASLGSLRNFFSLEASFAVGPPVESIDLLSESFYAAKLLSEKEEFAAGKVTFADYRENEEKLAYDEISFDTDRATRAFSELNASDLNEIITGITDQIRTSHVSKAAAIDASSSLLHMAVNLVPGGEDCLKEIFPKEENVSSYRTLYPARSNSVVIAWLERFAAGMSRGFAD